MTDREKNSESKEKEVADILNSISKEKEKGKGKHKDQEKKAGLADEYLDQLRRLKAEFENYRKRTVKEKEEYRKYALEGLLYGLIGVLDNLHRALNASTENHEFNSLLEGMNIVEKQFIELLKSQGVTQMETKIREKFDPYMHHAMSHEPSDEYPPDSIINVMQEGYRIGDRILRPAMVVVSSGNNKSDSEQGRETKSADNME